MQWPLRVIAPGKGQQCRLTQNCSGTVRQDAHATEGPKTPPILSYFSRKRDGAKQRHVSALLKLLERPG